MNTEYKNKIIKFIDTCFHFYIQRNYCKRRNYLKIGIAVYGKKFLDC